MKDINDRSFNLTTEPWLKVIELGTNQERMVSLIDLFENAQNYRQLAGEMRSQDFAILRLLLAILTSVYSRFDAKDEVYPWVKLDAGSMRTVSVDEESYEEDDGRAALLTTWNKLYQAGHFSAAVTQYLKNYTDCFDFFGDRPFYQVSTETYDALVPRNKQISTGKGKVAIKQLNRQISESGNSLAIFAPKSSNTKNEVTLAELVRWLITYQNFTGVTDKSKIDTAEKFSNSAGWIYRINPVYSKGKTLFETLMLNLMLVDPRGDDDDYTPQKPVWEYENIQEYIKERKKQSLPDNLAALYTTWSRILHIEWDGDTPTIFSAGIPIFEYDNALIEPMTTWRRDKKTNDYRPAVKGLRSLGIAMWRNFGQYVSVDQDDDIHEPGLVAWLRMLKEEDMIPYDKPIILNSIVLVSDGNATSQAPAFEVSDDMQMQAGVLFDSGKGERWPTRIEDTIELTQTIGNDYYHFVSDIGQIRNLDIRPFASKMSAAFYDQLNEPFREWLESLTSKDDREGMIVFWKRRLKKIVDEAVDEVLRSSSSRDIKGILVKQENGKERVMNIFTAKKRLVRNVYNHLGLKKVDEK